MARRLKNSLFWLLALVAIVLLCGFALLLGGAIPVASPDSPDEFAFSGAGITEAAAAPKAAVTTKPKPKPKPTAKQTKKPTKKSTTIVAPPRPQLATVVVAAVRGDCWVQARAGSKSGPLLEEAVLLQGESLRVRSAKVWLSLGASGNVDVSVNGKRRPVSPGTIAVVLAARPT